MKTLNLTLYGQILPDVNERNLSQTSARAFKEVLDANPDAEVINLHINSGGGVVGEGNAIYTMLKRHPATVNAYIDGECASMASAIAMAADKIIMPPHATMMIHNPHTIIYGNYKELTKEIENLKTLTEAFKQTYLLKAGDKLTEEKLTELLDNETKLTASQAYEYGLCDEIEFIPHDNTIAELKDRLTALEQKAEVYAKQLTVPSKTETELAPSIPDDNTPAVKGWFFNAR